MIFQLEFSPKATERRTKFRTQEYGRKKYRNYDIVSKRHKILRIKDRYL